MHWIITRCGTSPSLKSLKGHRRWMIIIENHQYTLKKIFLPTRLLYLGFSVKKKNIRILSLPFGKSSKLADFQLEKHPSWKFYNWKNIQVYILPIGKSSKLEVYQLEKHLSWKSSNWINFQFDSLPIGKASKLEAYLLENHPSWQSSNWKNIQIWRL